MAFNGITIHSLCEELKEELVGTHISKIAQPEAHEIILTIKLKRGTKRLLISANASLPLIYLTDNNKQSPLSAPNFCMLLRKHINNGVIKAIDQIDLERVIRITIEHRDEMGDLAIKYLYVEIMSKHSNIIFCNSDNMILDSIKHISAAVSSVREVLPGKEYFIPRQVDKIDPLNTTEEEFKDLISKKAMPLSKAIYTSFTGFSPLSGLELSCRADLDSDQSTKSLSEDDLNRLYREFNRLIVDLKENNYSPNIVYDKDSDKPIEFSSFDLNSYSTEKVEKFDSISKMLETFFQARDIYANMHQRSTDLRKIITNLLSRNKKKYSLQKKQLDDTKKKDKLRKKGELIRAYLYMIEDGSEEVTLLDYDTNENVKIKLNPDKSPIENANTFFDKYQKLKRTEVEVSEQLKLTEEAINHLESIKTSLDLAENTEDLDLIRHEMEEFGFIHKHSSSKLKKSAKEKPLHFVTKDGFNIYVGKNNYQNDYITFKLSSPEDWWFHAKQITGSHVLVQTNGKELPDDVFEIAASLAGYYSSGRDQNKIEIDYLKKKNVKKPNAAAPGFVIYYTNYSMVVKPEIRDVEKI
ncbi:MAG: NFACT family protein [Lachnospiraceae bacterium]|nr:NFACT family protein [Lachnospiraceae bacterium]